MAEQRQPFRFRLPWLTQGQPAAPAATPTPRPTADTQTPAAQPTAIIPIQRPAFRPAGIAPVLPPPLQAQLTPKTESQPPLPARTPTESRPASLPPSPSRSASQPQPVSQTAPQPRSPSRLASQPAGQTLQPTTSQVQPIAGVVSQLPFLLKQIQPTTQESSQRPPSSTQPPSLVPQREEQKPALSQPQPKKEIAQRSQLSGPVAATAPISKAVPEEKQLRGAELQEEQKQLEKQEVHERKETIKPTHRMDRNTVGESRQKPGIISGERAPLHKEIREDISRFVQKLGIGHPEQIKSEEPVSVITLTGDNRGAFMQLGSEPAKKEGSVHIQRRYKTNQETAETTTDAEGSSEKRISKYPMTEEDQGKMTYINSNMQSINNSILSDSHVTENDPGVHLNLSHNPVESIKSEGKTESFETHKAEFNVTPAEKRTYEPIVRRRCLRGLFMESSDSDPDNPEKPQRHGCRYGCREKSEDKEIGVL